MARLTAPKNPAAVGLQCVALKAPYLAGVIRHCKEVGGLQKLWGQEFRGDPGTSSASGVIGPLKIERRGRESRRKPGEPKQKYGRQSSTSTHGHFPYSALRNSRVISNTG